jgi:hypothetical protein
MTQHRECLNCNREIRGRVDKKFCSDQCRNDYNNQIKLVANNKFVRSVNSALRKNRRILEELVNNGKGELVKVPAEKLNTLGFKFKYLTHIYTTKKGTVYNYCYEYGYLPLENNWYLLVKTEKKSGIKEHL